VPGAVLDVFHRLTELVVEARLDKHAVIVRLPLV
jgi:hypothetical protein